MASQISHDLCVPIKTTLLDLIDACRPIRAEYQTKQFGYEVIEFLACSRIGELGTLSAQLDLFLGAARAHLAPGSFRVFATPFALPDQEGLAGTTIQPAAGYQFSVSQDDWHAQGSFREDPKSEFTG